MTSPNATTVNQQQNDSELEGNVNILSALSVVGAFIASLSVSLLSYAASLAQNKALDNNSLLVLNSIWLITTGGALFIAGSTGLIVVILLLWRREGSRRQYLRCVIIFMIVSLFTMLFAMVAGLILLANGLAVDTPLGNVHLPPTVIFPLLAAGVVIMMLLSLFTIFGS